MDEAPRGLPRWACFLGRQIGFLVLAVPAIALVAGVVLLPEYAAWKDDVYKRDMAAAQTADLQAIRDATERMLTAAYDDVVFIKRLAMFNCNLLPSDAKVLDSHLPEGPPPGVVLGQPHPRPAEPNDAFLRAAAKVAPNDPRTAPTRRGLLLVAAGLLLFAVLLFGPGARRRPAAA